MSTPAPAPAPAKKTAKLTAYRVLKFPEKPSQNSASGVTQGYKDAGEVNAASAAAAVRRIAETAGAGTYVAVPESSWKPVSVTVETQTVIKLGGSVA